MNHYPKVIIADDDEGVRDVLVSITRNTLPSAIISVAANGKEALGFYRRHGADLLISNFQMPEMSGPQLVEIVRGFDQNLPIIMVSGAPEAQAAGEKAGISQFVNKYDMIEYLPGTIRSLLGPARVLCLNRYLHG